MRFYLRLLVGGLLAGAATTVHAQTASLPPPLRATLDTVAVTSTTRVLTLAAAPGPELPGFPMTPKIQKAVFYARPTLEHEYDLIAVRMLVSDEFNRSNTGQVLIDLVLPDSSTHGPSTRHLLPAPLLVTAREVRKAKKGLITLDVRAQHISIPATGVFVVAGGRPLPGDQYLGDTLLLMNKREMRRAVYVKIGSSANPGALRVVNATDFISIREIRTAGQPQSWDFNTRTGMWQQRQAAYSHCPKCVISNAGLELVVREL